MDMQNVWTQIPKPNGKTKKVLFTKMLRKTPEQKSTKNSLQKN